FDADHLMAGHGASLGRGWSHHPRFSLWYGLGGPLLLAALTGMLLLSRRDWRKAVLVCTFPILYYALVGRGYTGFVRYVDPVVPFLCVTAAVAVVDAARRLPLRSQRAVSALTAAIALLVAVPSIERIVAFDRLAATPDTRLVAAAWLEAHRQASDW